LDDDPVQKMKFLAMLTAVVSGLSLPASADDAVTELLAGIEARQNAIRSMIIRYRWDDMIVDNLQTARPFPWTKSTDGTPIETESIRELVIAGEDFARRYRDTPDNIYLVRAQESVAYYRGVGEKSDEQNLLLMDRDQLSLRGCADRETSLKVIYAGIFPFESIVPMLKANANRIDVKTLQRDGFAEKEMSISMSGAAPLLDESIMSYFEELRQLPTFVVKATVVPDQGYLLRRLEFSPPGGDPIVSWESDDIREAGKGIWYPYEFYIICVSSPGEWWIRQYVIHDVSYVNQPIPPEKFSIAVTKGTKVHDHRASGIDATFTAAKALVVANAADALRLMPTKPKPAQPSHARNWQSVVIVAVIIALVAVSLAIRRR
jgi:hypothetical protein